MNKKRVIKVPEDKYRRMYNTRRLYEKQSKTINEIDNYFEMASKEFKKLKTMAQEVKVGISNQKK